MGPGFESQRDHSQDRSLQVSGFEGFLIFWNLPIFSVDSKPIVEWFEYQKVIPLEHRTTFVMKMIKSKFIHFLLPIFVLSACKNEMQTQREKIEGKIRQINEMIVLFQDHIDSRGAAISNMSRLSPAQKEEYHYDSLLHVQELQIKATKVFQQQRDSLQGVLNSLK